MSLNQGSWPSDWPRTLLIGAGIVGRAVARAHQVRAVPFVLADRDATVLQAAQGELGWSEADLTETSLNGMNLYCLLVGPIEEESERARSPIVIESIVEKLKAKQELLAALEAEFGSNSVLCSNTSTLRIGEIAGGLYNPQQVVGMHFFMPVHLRGSVELIHSPESSQTAVDRARAHLKRLGKHPVHCGDSPGFIVNRMLSPYLNQSLLLLCRGIDESRIARAARAYGMPLSPLELIDWIGAPTMFNAGRAFWQAFPHRIDPSPLVPALVKSGRVGRAVGAGLYDYDAGERADSLAEETQSLVQRYSVDPLEIADSDLLLLLSIPMWMEAQALLAEGVVDSMDSIDVAMVGGLGFDSDQTWSSFFAELGEERIERASETWSPIFRSMTR
ncbi:MAG: 3-hydroxyacyl-CoA dehydrogenase family protein [Planctomycetota bacterium]